MLLILSQVYMHSVIKRLMIESYDLVIIKKLLCKYLFETAKKLVAILVAFTLMTIVNIKVISIINLEILNTNSLFKRILCIYYPRQFKNNKTKT